MSDARIDYLEGELAKADEWKAQARALQAEVERLKDELGAALVRENNALAKSPAGRAELAEARRKGRTKW